MKWFMNMSIKWKLFCSMFTILLLMIIMLTSSYSSISSISTTYDHVNDIHFTTLITFIELKKNLDRSRAQMLSLLISGNSANYSKVREELNNRYDIELEQIKMIIELNSDNPELIVKTEATQKGPDFIQ